MKKGISFAVVMVVVLLVSYGAWRAERWVNWQFSYGPSVNEKLDDLEKRIEALENQ